jgi:threonine 3-dehydrogenase
MEDNILITGANSELGQGIINQLASHDKKSWVIAFDAKQLDEKIRPNVDDYVKGDVADSELISKVISENKITSVFHLDSLNLIESEINPEESIKVDFENSKIILDITRNIAQSNKKAIKFIFPSSIAVYGIPNINEKNATSKVKEFQFVSPLTAFGVTKLAVELFGTYYSRNYKLLDEENEKYLDFRSLRLPGIISTLSESKNDDNYAYSMLHSAAKGEGHESYVRPDSTLPFIIMPDAIHALIQIAEAERKRLKSCVYNVSSFSASAQQIAEVINAVFPDSAISFNPDMKKQKIVDSWPKDLDNASARSDWNWQPEFNIKKAFYEYLIPEIQNKKI